MNKMTAKQIANEVKKKLGHLNECGFGTKLTLIKREGDEEVLGIADMGGNYKEKRFEIDVVLMIHATDKSTKDIIGRTMKQTLLGNNPEGYLEFIRLADFLEEGEAQEESKINTGDRVEYEGEEFIVFEDMPVLVGNVTLFWQYTAKKAV